MIKIDRSYLENKPLCRLQILIEYAVKGKPAERFNQTDESNIAYWQVEHLNIPSSIDIRSVFKGNGNGAIRTVSNEELINGRWWIRENEKKTTDTLY